MTVVMVAGGFDPLHVGHVEHIRCGKHLFGRVTLVVSVNPDADLIAKKGFCFMPLGERMEIIEALRDVDMVIASLPDDGLQARTLEYVMPDIYLLGGDKHPESMESRERDVCDRYGIRVVYDNAPKIQSSSGLVSGRLF